MAQLARLDVPPAALSASAAEVAAAATPSRAPASGAAGGGQRRSEWPTQRSADEATLMSQLAQLDDALRSRAPTPADGTRRVADAHAAAEATRALQAAEAAVAELPPQRRAKRAGQAAPQPPPVVEEEEWREPSPPPPPPPPPKPQRPVVKPVPGPRIGPIPAHGPAPTLRGGATLGHTLSVGEVETLRASRPPPQPAAPPARAPRGDDSTVRCFNAELAAALLG
jgi:hypothetical protein